MLPGSILVSKSSLFCPIFIELIIAASAPKVTTAADFLHMIMEHNVKLVMKVCEDKVGTKEQCYKYTGKTTKTEAPPSLNLFKQKSEGLAKNRQSSLFMNTV